MYEKSILSLLGLDHGDFIVEPTITYSEKEIVIYAELKDDNPRICPNCNSHSVIIKDKEIVKINISAYASINAQKITLILKKRKYHCKKCNKNFSQINRIAQKNKYISTSMAGYIFNETQSLVSFSKIARDLKISESTVRTIFASLPTEGRRALPHSLSIDERRFTTDYGKYVCVLTNNYNGDIVDVVSSRTNDVLFEYFDSIPLKERQNVKFFISDMYEGYRTVKKKYFKNAVHIIDFFHITKLFTETIQIIRKQVMRKLDYGSEEYKFLKSKWKIFLINPCNQNNKAILERTFTNSKTGEIFDFKEAIKYYLRMTPEFLEIYNIYYDFCKYINPNNSKEKIVETLDFIILKSLDSCNFYINTLGKTLFNFREEIINTYCNNASYLSNAIAESTNAKIDKLINISNGIRTFKTLRKRLLHLKKR